MLGPVTSRPFIVPFPSPPHRFLPPAWTAAIPPAGMPSARRQAAQQGRGGRPSSAAAAAVPDAQASVADLLNQYD